MLYMHVYSRHEILCCLYLPCAIQAAGDHQRGDGYPHHDGDEQPFPLVVNDGTPRTTLVHIIRGTVGAPNVYASHVQYNTGNNRLHLCRIVASQAIAKIACENEAGRGRAMKMTWLVFPQLLAVIFLFLAPELISEQSTAVSMHRTHTPALRG